MKSKGLSERPVRTGLPYMSTFLMLGPLSEMTMVRPGEPGALQLTKARLKRLAGG